MARNDRLTWYILGLARDATCTCLERSIGPGWWDCKRRLYANGTKRPLFRGWIHAIVTAGLVPSMIGVTFAFVSGALPLRWWRMSFLLLGKLVSYVASANFHLHPAKTPASEIKLLKRDLIAISVAIWAPSSAFAMRHSEWVALFGIMLGVTFVNWRVVERQFSQNGCSPLPRSVLLLLYFAFTVAQIGWHYGYRELWFAGVISYVAGFLVSPPVHHHLLPAPWHKEGRNSWHEDFHVLLAVADAFFTALAVEFLQNPSIDVRP